MIALIFYLPALAIYIAGMYHAYRTDNMFALVGWACALITMAVLLLRSLADDREEAW